MLEEQIQSLIKRIEGTVGIAVKSLDKDFLFLKNAHEVFHAASIIKIPILIELLRQVEKEKISWQDEVILNDIHKIDGAGILKELHQGLVLTIEDLAILMIVISDNTASNILIDIVGMKNINQFMAHVGMNNSKLQKKFMVQLPNKQIINTTTPYDTMILLEKLYKGAILSRSFTDEALKILSRQQYREKVPLLLPQDLRIANKTGEVAGVRHDAGIVFLEGNPYVICVFSKELKDEIMADRLIAEISREVFQYMSYMNCS